MRIFCDFDGTITNRDSIVFLTEQFGAGPEYRLDILNAIIRREMTVFQAIEKELATVKATWEEAVVALREAVRIDPSFPEFVLWCRRRGYPLSVVSSGMQPVVELFVGEFGLPIFAHSVEIDSKGWSYKRIEERDKEFILKSLPEEEDPVVFVGDGTSDITVIPYVDILFARKGFYLSEYCRTHGIAHRVFENFEDVERQLEEISRASRCRVFDHGLEVK